MIPDHLINKAAQAILDGNALQLAREDGLPVRYWALADLPKDDADMFRREAQAALEAVAATIWDQGHQTRAQRGPDECTCNAWNEDECACGNYGTGQITTPNPYKVNP